MIDLLLTVGYVDGLLHEGEERFIKDYLARLVEHVAKPPETLQTWWARVEEGYTRLNAEIAALAAEVVAAGDDRYTRTRLEVRAVTLFRNFSPADQQFALELLRTVMQTDGTISDREQALYDELVTYFEAPRTTPAPSAALATAGLRIDPPQHVPLASFSHALLDDVEHRYATEPAQLHAQLHGDYGLIFQAITTWERQRARGNGRLLGVTDIGQLPPGTRLLDNRIHVLRPDRPTELVVLGDLHGCYSCLKAALLQSDFIERARRHQQDPANHPDVKLVLLGDYIDRGHFSFEGVMRAALQLLVTLPDHVILLRGNHEYLIRNGEHVVSAVMPAEAVPALTERAPVDVLEAYKHLFDHMPTALLFDRTLFVHGGIPRDDTLAERYRDLSSLDDAVIRFEMMWGDPVDTDEVPVALQRASSRFNFGRNQFAAFMQRVGCHTMIRGHEQVDAGFHTVFDLGACKLHTLFSAGGHDNADLPTTSRYRSVTPTALTVRAGEGAPHAFAWPLQYQPFLRGEHNGLYR